MPNVHLCVFNDINVNFFFLARLLENSYNQFFIIYNKPFFEFYRYISCFISYRKKPANSTNLKNKKK